MTLNISQAARAVGITRQTLYKHLKQGKVSFVIGRDGRKNIEPSELMRVYGELTGVDVNSERQPTQQITPGNDVQVTHKNDPLVTSLRDHIAALEARIDHLTQQLELSHEREQDIRALLKMRLLPAPEPTSPPPPSPTPPSDLTPKPKKKKTKTKKSKKQSKKVRRKRRKGKKK